MANVNDIMNEIDRIEGAKGDLAGAIEEKGVEVPAGAKIEEYPGLVRQIQQGGTSDCVKFTPQTLSAAEQAQARDNIGAAGTKIGVISQTQTWSGTGSNPRTYAMSGQVYGIIPQSFIDLATSAGATFNAVSGYFELNGLTDISYGEMEAIYNYGNVSDKTTLVGVFAAAAIRTNFAIHRGNDSINMYGSAVSTTNADYCGIAAGSRIETLCIYAGTNTQLRFKPVVNLSWGFRACYYLRNVIGVISCSSFGAANRFGASFYLCYSLENIYLYGIKFSVSFADSSILSKASLLYMINNEASTGPITITLNSAVYNKCISGGDWYTDVSTALSNHTNVSLASA